MPRRLSWRSRHSKPSQSSSTTSFAMVSMEHSNQDDNCATEGYPEQLITNTEDTLSQVEAEKPKATVKDRPARTLVRQTAVTEDIAPKENEVKIDNEMKEVFQRNRQSRNSFFSAAMNRFRKNNTADEKKHENNASNNNNNRNNSINYRNNNKNNSKNDSNNINSSNNSIKNSKNNNNNNDNININNGRGRNDSQGTNSRGRNNSCKRTANSAPVAYLTDNAKSKENCNNDNNVNASSNINNIRSNSKNISTTKNENINSNVGCEKLEHDNDKTSIDAITDKVIDKDIKINKDCNSDVINPLTNNSDPVVSDANTGNSINYSSNNNQNNNNNYINTKNDNSNISNNTDSNNDNNIKNKKDPTSSSTPIIIIDENDSCGSNNTLNGDIITATTCSNKITTTTTTSDISDTCSDNQTAATNAVANDNDNDNENQSIITHTNTTQNNVVLRRPRSNRPIDEWLKRKSWNATHRWSLELTPPTQQPVKGILRVPSSKSLNLISGVDPETAGCLYGEKSQKRLSWAENLEKRYEFKITTINTWA